MKEDSFQLGVKGFIENKQGLFLALKGFSKAGEYWDLPGGRVQLNEPCEKTLQREVQEETGIHDLLISSHLCFYLSNIRIQANNQNFGLIYSFYHCSTESQEVILSEEHLSFEWLEAADLLKRLSLSDHLDLVNKLSSDVLSHLRKPLI